MEVLNNGDQKKTKNSIHGGQSWGQKVMSTQGLR